MEVGGPAVITRRTIGLIGLSQLTCWGISYYLIGVFGEFLMADLGWSRPVVYGGFSLALVVMGLTSPMIGALIDRRGGRPVMAAGSCLIALGCALLAAAWTVWAYYLAWLCLGVAMRMTLYDAAFAALVRIGGPAARRPISQVTLLGGLASTVFWPIGHALALALGWREAILVYAGVALLTIPLHLAIPAGRYRQPAVEAEPAPVVPVPTPEGQRTTAVLYALVVMLAAFLNSAMSAHMVGMLAGLGLSASLAVWVATLRGIGQSLARLGEVLFGSRLQPAALNLAAAATLPGCFLAGLLTPVSTAAALVFALGYGAGNGLLTITRGTLPLVLFDPLTYGTYVGRLLTPSFFLAALAPLLYALTIERFGDAAALYLSLGVALLMVAAAVGLHRQAGDEVKRH